DAAETGAERADEARKSEVPHSEVVVDREDLDQDWSLRRELVFVRERLQGIMCKRNRVFLENRRLVRLELEGQIRVLYDVELLELVEQVEEVLGHPVEAILLEGPLEGLARVGLIARPHQVQPE